MKMRLRTMFVAVLALLTIAVAIDAAQQTNSAKAMLEAARKKEVVDGDLSGAIEQYKQVVSRFKNDRASAAEALVRMAELYQKLGDAEAVKVYEQLLREFGDQKEAAATARQRLAALKPVAAAELLPAARQIWKGGANGPMSADGRFLTFVDGTGDLGIRDLVAGENRNLTNSGGWVASGDYTDYAAISPDGKQVAYHWFVEKGGRTQLRVVPLTTGDSAKPSIVVDRDEYMRPFGWSPDGKLIFVVRWESGNAISIGTVSVQNGSFQSIKSLEWRNPGKPSLSSDGRYIAYDVRADENTSSRDIFVLASDGSREVTAVGGSAHDFSPIWSPDNSRLIFISNRSGSNSVWMTLMENGQPKGSPEWTRFDVQPSYLEGVTQAGTLYYGISGDSRRNIYLAALDQDMRATAPAIPATDRLMNDNAAPAWSRDGAYLAYYSLRNPAELVIRSAATGEERNIPLPPGTMSQQGATPKWFPDNRSVLILVQGPQGQAPSFYRLSLDTGKADLVKRTSGGSPRYDLSTDGRTIYYIGSPAEGRRGTRLMRLDIESGREAELREDSTFTALAISPDGTELASLKSMRTDELRERAEAPGVVEVMPAAGGPFREVFRNSVWYSGSRFGTLAWTPDGRSLVFVQDDGAFWRVSARGGVPEKIGVSIPSGDGEFKSPAIHPDGRRMAFAAIESGSSQLWALERFLPPSVRK